MEKILSIIIPSYNMEDYLAKALESVLGIDDSSLLDVIVVNDGSKDRTIETARDFESRYTGVVTVIDKENGNYGSCINAGLKIAQGKYIKILDADDTFFTEPFGCLVAKLKEIDVDLVFSDYIKFYAQDDIAEINCDLPIGQIVTARDIYQSTAMKNIQLPAITYRTELLRRIDYKQTEGISYSDMEWCFVPMSQVEKIYYLDRPVYRYFLSREGQTMDISVQVRRFSHVLKSLTTIFITFSKLNVQGYCKEYLIGQLLRHLLYVYRFYLVDNKSIDRKDLRVFDELVKLHCPQAYEASGNFEYRLHLPYKFVAEWRNGRHEYIPKSVLVKEWIYDKLGHIHVMMRKFAKRNNRIT